MYRMSPYICLSIPETVKMLEGIAKRRDAPYGTH